MAAKLFLTLGDNVKMPMLGLGTGQLKEEAEAVATLNAALESGYRHIDTAYVYQNEKIIGKVLNEWLTSGKLKREDIFITTKLPLYGVHPDRVELFIKKSLENLQLDYVDLYLIHFPVALKYDESTGQEKKENNETVPEPKTDHVAVWKKMEEQVDAGRAKAIGLSNFNIPQIETVLKSARIKPANLQVEVHVYLQQRQLVDFCHKNGITVVAYSPLGSPARNKILKKLQREEKVPDILGDAVVKKLAKKYLKTPAQIVLRFLIQRGVAAIPKTASPNRLLENIAVFDFTLDDNDFKELCDLEVGEKARIGDFKLFKGIEQHPDYPMKS